MKLAIFGGTFDPVHCAHLTVAREAAARFGLDKVVFVPAGNPPHKELSTGASFENRCRMVELACAGEPAFSVSRIEEGPAPSYSIRTIESLRASLGRDDQLYFVIGADAFAEIDTWHRAEDVVRNVDFIVVTRPGHDYVTPDGARVHRLDTVALPVSSSEIRVKLAARGEPAELPPAVLGYIREKRLYRD